jgi:hypothetical protein
MDEHDILELKTKVDDQTTANKAEHESFKRRLKDLEDGGMERTEMLLAIQRQGDAIQSMDKKMDGISASVGRVEKRVDEIEKEPADKWKKISFEIVKYVVLAVVGAAVGYFLKG